MPSPKPDSPTSATILPVPVRLIDARRGSRALCCPGCRLPLNLIQPDENEPSRLLGICDNCVKWTFLVELEPEWRRILMVELPDGPSILRACGDELENAAD